jgi:hypothetical protein
MNDDLSPVRAGSLAPEQGAPLKPVYQLDDTVMAQLHPIGEFSDAGHAPERQSAQRQQEQVLLRLEARFARGLFAPIQIGAYEVSKFR